MAAILDDLDDNPDWDKSPEESLSDYSIHIIVTGTDLPAIVYHVHRVMLAVRSTHFKSIILPAGSDHARWTQLHMDEDEAALFPLVLDYIYDYNDTRRGPISNENSAKLCKLAHALGIARLMRAVFGFWREHLAWQNMVECCLALAGSEDDALRHRMITLTAENFYTITPTCEILATTPPVFWEAVVKKLMNAAVSTEEKELVSKHWSKLVLAHIKKFHPDGVESVGESTLEAVASEDVLPEIYETDTAWGLLASDNTVHDEPEESVPLSNLQRRILDCLSKSVEHFDEPRGHEMLRKVLMKQSKVFLISLYAKTCVNFSSKLSKKKKDDLERTAEMAAMNHHDQSNLDHLLLGNLVSDASQASHPMTEFMATDSISELTTAENHVEEEEEPTGVILPLARKRGRPKESTAKRRSSRR